MVMPKFMSLPAVSIVSMLVVVVCDRLRTKWERLRRSVGGFAHAPSDPQSAGHPQSRGGGSGGRSEIQTNKQTTIINKLWTSRDKLRGLSEKPRHGGLGGGVGGCGVGLVTGVGGGGVGGEGGGQAVQPQAPKGGRGEEDLW